MIHIWKDVGSYRVCENCGHSEEFVERRKIPGCTEESFEELDDSRFLEPPTKIPEKYDPRLVDIGALKFDHGKPQMELLLDFHEALRGVGEVATMGARKYARHGWTKMDPEDGFNRTTAALMRHMLDEQEDLYDSESDLLHCMHVAWNALARACFLVRQGHTIRRTHE